MANELCAASSLNFESPSRLTLRVTQIGVGANRLTLILVATAAFFAAPYCPWWSAMCALDMSAARA